MVEAPRIGIDGYNLAMAKGTGVATYARTLAHCVNSLGWPLDLIYGIPISPKARAEIRQSLFYARLAEDTSESVLPWTVRRLLTRATMLPTTRDLVEIPQEGAVITRGLEERVPPADRLLTRGSAFSVSARYFRRFGRFMPLRVDQPPDIMHWTYPLPLRMIGARNVYTFHDLVPLRLPHTSLEDRAYYDRLLRHCVRSADRIVTVSEASRQDICNFYPQAEAKIVDTKQPVEVPKIADSTEYRSRLRRLFDLDYREYFLFFGAIEPKKNVGRIIEAYLAADISRPLVIVGSDAWRSDRELRLLGGAHGRQLEGTRSIRRIEYLPRNLLMELVAGARSVLFPSLYEGFGLPAAEAAALGVPVLGSNQGSLPEVIGPGGLLVDPYDVRCIAGALRRLDADDDLRARLAAAARDHVDRFSMDHYRATMRSFYLDLANSSNGQRTS